LLDERVERTIAIVQRRGDVRVNLAAAVPRVEARGVFHERLDVRCGGIEGTHLHTKGAAMFLCYRRTPAGRRTRRAKLWHSTAKPRLRVRFRINSCRRGSGAISAACPARGDVRRSTDRSPIRDRLERPPGT